MLRVGHGYDIHQIVVGDGIYLGGVYIPCGFALKGHSDADVVLHAITDSLLGALADNDIGYFFSDKDEKNKQRSSSDFLKYAFEKIKKQGYQIANIDCTVICEKPSIARYRDTMKNAIASALDISIREISIKGKSNEGLDAVGQKKAIKAHCVTALCK